MKIVRISIALAVTLLVAACFFSPGKFDARMTVMKDGSFTYHYSGEILMVTGQSFVTAMAERESRNEAFDPEAQTCTGEPPAAGARSAPGDSPRRPYVTVAPGARSDDEAENVDVRECTAAEIEAKRREWESGRAVRQAEQKKQLDAMKAMFGGIDPGDPATMTEFANRLQGQGGWKRVVHKGNGLFDVDYEISGRLDHDFVFPIFPNMDFIIPFVQVSHYGGGKVRVTAPALIRPGQTSGGVNAQALGAMAAMTKGGETWPFRPPEGRFTLTTDGAVLTNNTRNGPAAQGAMKILIWPVTALDTVKPEALIQL